MPQLRLTLCWLLSSCLGCAAPLAAEQAVHAKQWCVVQEEKLVELSGLAPYRGGEEKLFWAHNDGAQTKLYLLDSDGETRATLEIQDTETVDCEDLCSFQIGESRFLLLADTGDNALRRKSSRLHLLAEPNLKEFGEAEGKKKKKDKAPNLKVTPLATLEFTYPDGARNCEGVGVDVGTQSILLVTKEKNPGCEAFCLPLPLDKEGKLTDLPTQPQEAKLTARITVPTITGLTVAPDGKRVVLLGRSQLFEFSRPSAPAADSSDPFVRIFKAGPRTLAKPKQEQGESVCFGLDGKKLYVASEGKKQPIWELELEK